MTERLRIQAEIPNQGHTNVNTLWFSGMDTIVVEQNWSPRNLNPFEVKLTICANNSEVYGHSGVCIANFLERKYLRKIAGQPRMEFDALMMSGSFVAMA